MKTKALAELLLIRKDLQGKVDRLATIDRKELFENVIKRKPVAEGVDDVIATVAKMSFQQFTHCYDWHAKQLRRVDAAIQRANWATQVEIDAEVLDDYIDPYVWMPKGEINAT